MTDTDNSIRVERYTDARKAEWDAFVASAKNASFLFFRDYMDYHRDRFADHSLMAYQGHRLVGILPANLAPDGALVSHAGLTYGGLAVGSAATLQEVLTLFRAILLDLRGREIDRLIYKRFPAFYNVVPDDDVAFALFLLGATLFRRDCALVITMANRLPLRRDRRSHAQRARDANVEVVAERSFQPFWEQILVPRLADRFATVPVHSYEEITLLASRFPENIKQFSAYLEGQIVAGTTIFETPTVMHVQYTAASEQGLKIGALDLLFSWLIDDVYRDKRYVDFGTCNGKDGLTLNRGLLGWKEGFGARCFAHDFYEIRTDQADKLESMLEDRPRVDPGS
jgi:hypothetical protein